MAMNIFLVVMCVIALGAGIWAYGLGGRGDKTEEEKKEEQKEES